MKFDVRGRVDCVLVVFLGGEVPQLSQQCRNEFSDYLADVCFDSRGSANECTRDDFESTFADRGVQLLESGKEFITFCKAVIRKAKKEKADVLQFLAESEWKE